MKPIFLSVFNVALVTQVVHSQVLEHNCYCLLAVQVPSIEPEEKVPLLLLLLVKIPSTAINGSPGSATRKSCLSLVT